MINFHPAGYLGNTYVLESNTKSAFTRVTYQRKNRVNNNTAVDRFLTSHVEEVVSISDAISSYV